MLDVNFSTYLSVRASIWKIHLSESIFYLLEHSIVKYKYKTSKAGTKRKNIVPLTEQSQKMSKTMVIDMKRNNAHQTFTDINRTITNIHKSTLTVRNNAHQNTNQPEQRRSRLIHSTGH